MENAIQQVLLTEEQIAEKVKESGMQSPAVIVIGETAEMEL